VTDPERFIDPSTPPEVLGLRAGVDAPDLSASILGEVDRRRGWLSRRQRRLVCAARWGAGVALVAVFAGVLLVQRTTPVDDMIVPRERPLADLMQNFRSEASVAVQSVSTQMRSIPEQLVSQSQVMVTGRIERQGNRRIVQLDAPVSVIGEQTDVPVLISDWLAEPGLVNAANAVAPTGEASSMQWRQGAWPTLSPESFEPEGPLLEAQGLDDDAR